MDNTAPPSPASYGRGHRALEIAAIAFAFGSLLWIAVRIVAATHSVGGWIGIALAAVGRLHRLRPPVGIRALGGRHRG